MQFQQVGVFFFFELQQVVSDLGIRYLLIYQNKSLKTLIFLPVSQRKYGQSHVDKIKRDGYVDALECRIVQQF